MALLLINQRDNIPFYYILWLYIQVDLYFHPQLNYDTSQ